MTSNIPSNERLYVKRPIPIRAVQLTQELVEAYCFDDGPLPEGVRFCSSSLYPPEREIRSIKLICQTLENQSLEAAIGCWIVGPGARGEFWPVQDDIFRATYMDAPSPDETPPKSANGTPGPWEAKRLDRHHWVIQSDRGVIAKTAIPTGATEEEIEGNALRLAAAGSPVETTARCTCGKQNCPYCGEDPHAHGFVR